MQDSAEHIKIRTWPPEHAMNACERGFFVEAIQVLHGWIEIQARGLLIVVGSVHHASDMKDTWDEVEKMPYRDVVRALLAVGQLRKEQADELLRINAARNRIIHDIFKEPYEEIFPGYPKHKFDQIFSAALEWADRLIEMNDAMVS